MIKRLIIGLFLLLMLFGGIFGWKYLQMQKMQQMASQPQPPASVAATEVREVRWQPRLKSVGSVRAVQGVELTSEVDGIVERLAFESGQRAEAGAVLVELDSEVDRALLEGLIAERRLAELQFERNARLFKEKSVSRSDLDSARARLDEAEAAVQAQRARLKKKTIKAPFTGVLGIRQIDKGQYLTPGTPIVSLQALDPIYADFSLPERHLARLAEGQQVVIRVQAYPGETFAGRIEAISSSVEKSTRQIQIRAKLDNPDARLKPGMFAEVEVQLPDVRQVRVLPRHAVTYNPYGSSVFLIQEKDDTLVVQNRQISTGETRDGMITVTEGLDVGDRVVSAGQVKLRNGQAVTIDNSVELSGEYGE